MSGGPWSDMTTRRYVWRSKTYLRIPNFASKIETPYYEVTEIPGGTPDDEVTGALKNVTFLYAEGFAADVYCVRFATIDKLLEGSILRGKVTLTPMRVRIWEEV